jgi:tetratricopeptide (TPR) repeat protein
MSDHPARKTEGGRMVSRSARTEDRSTWLMRFLAAGVALLAAVLWVTYEASRVTPAGLPPLPAFDHQPVELRTRITLTAAGANEAQGQARSAAVATLGRLYHANGYLAEAAACWDHLQASDRRNARWTYYQADVRRQQSDYAGMLRHLEQTVALDPTYAPAWLQLADSRFKTGEYPAASAAYQRRLELVPADPYAQLGLARIAHQQAQLTEAGRRLDELLDGNPEFASARNLLAEILAAQGDQDRSERERIRGGNAPRFRPAPDPWLDELLVDCYDYETLCIRGTMAAMTGHETEALAWFERARQLYPDRFAAHEALGNVYLDRRDGPRALAQYERALATPEARPSARFYVHLARAHRLAGQTENALQVLQQGLGALGSDWELHDALGTLLLEQDDVPGALAAHRAAVRANPAETGAAYHLAVALLASGQADEGVAELQRAYTLNPAHAPTLSLFARLEMESGRWRSALTYLTPLYAAQPELEEARSGMLQALLFAGQEAEQEKELSVAEKHYREGLRIEPDHAQLLSRLGQLLLAQRRLPEAIEHLTRYHELEPASDESTLLLVQAFARAGHASSARQVLQEAAQHAERDGRLPSAQRYRNLLQRLQTP